MSIGGGLEGNLDSSLGRERNDTRGGGTSINGSQQLSLTLVNGISISGNCNLGVGVEYFFLPSLSIAAEANGYAGVSGSVSVTANAREALSAYQNSSTNSNQ